MAYLFSRSNQRKNTKEKGAEKEIEDLIIDYWENESNNTFKSRYKVWVDRQVKLGVSDNTVSKYKSDYKRFFEGYPIETINISLINEDTISEHIVKVLSEKKVPYFFAGLIRTKFDTPVPPNN